MALGDLAKLSYRERCAYYENANAQLTSDAQANNLARVRWLKAMTAACGPFPRVLDIGCNDGFATRWMIDDDACELLVGLDLNERALKIAMEARDAYPCPQKAIYLKQDYRDFRDRDFDAVVNFELLEHFTEDEGAHLLQFSHDALKPGGIGFLNTPNIRGAWGETNPDECHLKLYGLDSLCALFDRVLGIRPQFHDYMPSGPFLSCYWSKQ
jgi:cyclopropane fatty-acyl-phospholipid synthase-like methyltransferase